MKRKFIIIIIAALSAFLMSGQSRQEIEYNNRYFFPDSPDSENSENSEKPNAITITTTLNEIKTPAETASSAYFELYAPETSAMEITSVPVITGTSAPPITTFPSFTLPDVDILTAENEYDNEWAFYLINAENPLPDDYIPETRAIFGEHTLDVRAADYAVQMLADAKRDGINLLIVSAYRSRTRQQNNFNAQVQRYIDAGYTEADALYNTGREIAAPGASEHNAGLAVDILDMSANLRIEFDETKEFEWLVENSWRYGFILRYPKNTTHITGFIYEPWHFRFVGVRRAKEITESGLTLEEFIRNLTTDD